MTMHSTARDTIVVVEDGDDACPDCQHPADCACDTCDCASAVHAAGPTPSVTGMSSRPPRDTLVRNQPGDFEVRDAPGGPPTLVGHFSVFNQWTRIESAYEGRFMERVAPGAFTRSLNAGRIKVTFNHGKDVLGDQLLGVPTALEEDGFGARYEVPLFDGIPPLILSGLRANAYGSSFRFRVLKEDFNPNAKGKVSATNPDGLPERTITEAQVFEFGPVSYPAYEGATAGIRSGTDDYLLSLIRGAADALPDAGPGAQPHSDGGTREQPPEPTPPAATAPRPVRRFRSDEDWIAFLQETPS